MILLYISAVVNVIFLAALTYYLLNPNASDKYLKQKNEKLIDQLKKEYENQSKKLEDYYQSRRLEIQENLAAKTKQTAEEISSLRQKLQSDIASEMEAVRETRIKELNDSFGFKIEALKQKEAEVERVLLSKLEAIRIEAAEEEEIISKKLESMRSYEAAAIEARIRDYEQKNKETFYMINLSDDDIDEIDELEKIMPHLRNEMPLRRAIFDIYYRGPFKDMVTRVLKNTPRVTGIYKITFVETKEVYIGQSVDIKNRWLQHIRRGFGLDDGPVNKLYPAMQKYGIHKFKFELIEECPEDLLSEKEKYWSDYFGAQLFGYTMKV